MTEINRKTYIGSSDAKDILDGNWHQLWLEKTGRAEPADLTDQFNVQLGIHTEDFHLDWTIRRMIEAGEIADEVPKSRQYELRPKGFDFVAAHIDAAVALPGGSFYINGDNNGWCPIETKHSSGKRSIDELLEWYMPQMQHHLWCAGTDKAVVSVIQGNLEPERVWIGRSEDWIKVYAVACKRFWAHVTADKPPARPSPGVEVTPTMRDAIPVNGLVRRCADGNNEFIDKARTMIDNEAGWRAYDAAKKALKAMVDTTEGEVYSKILTLKRDKRGAVRFTFHEAEGQAA